MLVFGVNVYMIAIPIILFVCRLIEMKLNDKDYNMKGIEKRKYFGYLGGLLVIVLLFAGLIVL